MYKIKDALLLLQNLKQDGAQCGTSFRGQNLKEMLRSCSHYNTQAREDALTGLKDLFQNNPGILKDNLNAVLQQILRLTTDIESSVRKRFLVLISVTFKALSDTEISPFFSNIVAYLCSAMTHIDETIRLHSLKFLDLCLEFFPQLVKERAKNIVLNFTNVVSVKKSGMPKSSGVPIKTELKAKVMSQKMQLEVLSQLNRLLRVVFGNGIDQNEISSHFSSPSNSHAKFGSPNQSNTKPIDPSNNLKNDGNGDYGNTSISSSIVSNTPAILVSNFSLKTTASEFKTSTTNEDWLKEFVSSLAPVLFEYWVECCPAEFSVNLIPIRKVSVSLQIMKEILEILVTLVESCERNISHPEWFRLFLNNELGHLVNVHFNPVFPLSFTLQQSGRKSKVQPVESITDVKLNILIAQLLSYYIGDIENYPKWPSKILTYIQEVLVAQLTNRQRSQFIASDIKCLTCLVIKMHSIDMPKHLEDKKVQLLEVIYQLFDSSCATLKVWLDFVAEIINGARNEPTIIVLVKWLKSLLKILNKDITQDLKYEIFFICKSGILQRFPHLTNAIAEELPRVFAVEYFSRLSEKLQRIVIEVLYHNGQVPSRELYGVLATLCHSGCLSVPVFEYLLLVIHQLVHSSSPVTTLGDYLSFILSITIGHTQKQLEHFQTNAEGQPNCYNFKEINKLYTVVAEFENNNANPQITKESWEHENKVIEIICQVLAQSDYCSRFLEMLEAALCKLFSKYPTLPVDIVYRLLYLTGNLLHLTKDSDTREWSIKHLSSVATWCAVVWHFLLKVSVEFGKVNFMQTLARQLKAVISKLCKSSETVLKIMLGLFIPCTMTGCNPQLTCQVLTEVLKELKDTIPPVHLSVLNDLYKNLESASTKKILDSQIFSDFKYQYQICAKRSLMCD